MVTNVTSLGRSGLYDWLIQRVSAVILGIYFLCVTSFMLSQGEMSFAVWQGYITSAPMKIFTLLAMLALAAHAWIGLWTISTDYIKPTGIRFIFQAVCGIATFVYVVWAIMILWGA